ncbi:MAG TPA: LamG-like jellyroll fold domain-containing protein, partial [Candidatus Acidoferrum sp.]|nr:LamG-like jellyroll fold domain-containing protein [Candidatus Acidoferrum sp.]
LETTGTGSTQSLSAASSLRFGSLQTGTGFFLGSVDEVRIFNRALGHLEVAALYDDSVAPPPAPAGLLAVAANGQVTLSWADASGASAYAVGRSASPGGPYSTVATVTDTGFMDVGLTNGTTYYYVVWSVNSAGQGAPSAEVSAAPYTLAAWFKADAITGLATGSALGTWADASGIGNDATQSVAGQQPTFVTDAINGLPVVRFIGSNSTYLAFSRPVQDDFTILCVYRSSQGIGAGTAFYEGAGLVNGEVAGLADDFGVSLNADGFLLAGTGNPDTTVVSSGSTYADGQPHLFTFKRTESAGALALYADGVLVGTATGGAEPLTAPARLVLGAQQTLLNFLTGDIAEVKIFNSPLADSDRMAEEHALQCKYGLGGGPALPGVPAGLEATPGNRQIIVTWTVTPRATGYNLWRSTNDGASYTLIASALSGTGFVDTGAVSGLTNYYEVAALNECGTSARSASMGVLLPLPALVLGTAGRWLAVSWPDWASDWQLWSATNLALPVVWSLVTNAVSSSNGQFVAFLPIGSGACFFRLASP